MFPGVLFCFLFFLGGAVFLGFFVLFWFLASTVYLDFRIDTLGVFFCLFGMGLMREKVKKPLICPDSYEGNS